MKLEEATNNDPWGPHGKLLAEIAAATYDYEGYMEIMSSLDARFQKAIAKPERWRLAYKSLLVLEHMAKHGDARCVDGLRKEGAMRTLGRLTEFKYVDPASMKDHGINVRNRAELLRDFMQDPQRILEERTKARANRGKYTGVASTGGGEGFGAGAMGGFGSTAAGGGGGDAATGGGNGSQWDSAPERKRWGSVSRGPTVAPPAESFLGETPGSSAGAPAASGGDDGGFAQRSNGGGYQAPVAVAAPEPRRPKTLSETKVNPAIAASFGGLAVPVAAAAAPAPAAAAAPASTRAQDPMADLMGLDASPSPAGAPLPAADPFAAAAAAAAPAAAPLPAADPFAAAAPAPAAAPADPFGGAFAQTAAPAAPAVSADPFAAGAAAPPAAAPDAGFGAFTQVQGAVSSTAAMPMSGAPAMTMGGMGMGFGAGQGAGMFVSGPSGAAPALGGAAPSPSKAPAAKDPFADLLG